MPYTDWDIYGTTATSRFVTSAGYPEMNFAATAINEAAVTPPVGIPVVGTGSAHMHVANGQSMNVLPKFPGFMATDRGLVGGKIRTVMHWNDQGGVEYFGLVAMQSVLDLTSGTFNGYGLVCDTLGFNNTIKIVQFDSALITGWTALAISAPGQFSNNTPMAIEFEWDATSLTSVSLIVRTGSMLNFSNLSVLLSFIDSVSPHVTSVGEGLFAAGVSGPVAVYWDSTTIFKRI